MHSFFRCLGLVATFALLLPVLTAADTKSDVKKSKLIPVGEPVTAKLAKVDAGGMRLTVHYKEPYRTGSGNKIRIAYKDVKAELDADENMTVRLAQPPVTIDDKGNRRKMNAKELKAFKGPAGQSGYKGDVTDLKPEQTVTIQFGKPRGAKPDEKAKIMSVIIQGEVVK